MILRSSGNHLAIFLNSRRPAALPLSRSGDYCRHLPCHGRRGIQSGSCCKLSGTAGPLFSHGDGAPRSMERDWAGQESSLDLFRWAGPLSLTVLQGGGLRKSRMPTAIFIYALRSPCTGSDLHHVNRQHVNRQNYFPIHEEAVSQI